MRATKLVSSCLVLTSILVRGSSDALAKINVNLITYYSTVGVVERWDAETGTKILRYEIIDGFGGTPESVDSLAMSPNGRLFASLNNLGFIDIIRLNTNTGMTILPPGYNCCGDGVPFASYFGGTASPLTFDVHGDIFATGVNATYFPDFFPGDRGKVFRFDGQTGVPKGTLELEEAQHITGFDVSPDGQFFYAMHRLNMAADIAISKFSYSPMSNVFTQVAQYPIGALNGDLTIGPDGILYVSDFQADVVLRYDADGNFIDQFIDDYVYEFEWIEGKLIGVAGFDRVVEINKLDGSIVDTLIDASTYAGPGTLQFFGMAAFSVPEPSAAGLMLSVVLLSHTCLLSRKRLC